MPVGTQHTGGNPEPRSPGSWVLSWPRPSGPHNPTKTTDGSFSCSHCPHTWDPQKPYGWGPHGPCGKWRPAARRLSLPWSWVSRRFSFIENPEATELQGPGASPNKPGQTHPGSPIQALPLAEEHEKMSTHPPVDTESSPGRTGAVRSEGAGPGRSPGRHGHTPAPSPSGAAASSGPEGRSWIQSSAAPAALLGAEDLRARQREGRLPGEASREGGEHAHRPPQCQAGGHSLRRPHTDSLGQTHCRAAVVFRTRSVPRVVQRHLRSEDHLVKTIEETTNFQIPSFGKFFPGNMNDKILWHKIGIH